MTISDIIEAFIKELIGQSDENQVEIQRNELAKYFNCVPSQINYVLSTRFSPKQGYVVESQRGGGGFIKITQVVLSQSYPVYHIINEVGDHLTLNEAVSIIQLLLERDIINSREARLMRTVISEATLRGIEENKKEIRSRIFKKMLMILLEED